MAGQQFQYDDSGNTFFYFLTSFVGLIVIPATYYLWPRDQNAGESRRRPPAARAGPVPRPGPARPAAPSGCAPPASPVVSPRTLPPIVPDAPCHLLPLCPPRGVWGVCLWRERDGDRGREGGWPRKPGVPARSGPRAVASPRCPPPRCGVAAAPWGAVRGGGLCGTPAELASSPHPVPFSCVRSPCGGWRQCRYSP